MTPQTDSPTPKPKEVLTEEEIARKAHNFERYIAEDITESEDSFEPDEDLVWALQSIRFLLSALRTERTRRIEAERKVAELEDGITLMMANNGEPTHP